MNYEKMSDFEINGYVSMYVHGFSWIEFVDGYVSSVKCGNECSPGFAMVEVSDYCNNPSDAWPVIMENFISFDQPRNGLYIMVWGYSDAGLITMQCLRKDALRTAMIVFLKIMGVNRG